MNPIHVEGLTKDYGAVRALNAVDLTIPGGGQIVGLLGPNGAGKTTLIEILEGLRPRSAGHVEVFGIDPAVRPRELRARLGVQLQATAFVPELTVRETLQLYGALYPTSLPPEEVLPSVDLVEKTHARVSSLSGGQKQRLALAMAMLHDPDLFVLDEPTSGLDPIARRQIHDILRRLRTLGKTVLISSHYLDEIESLADRVIILRAGDIVADGTPLDLLAKAAGQSTLWFAVEGTQVDPVQFLPGCTFEGTDGGLLRFATDDPTRAVVQLADALRTTNSRLLDLRLKRPTLEDLYVQLIEHGETTLSSSVIPTHAAAGAR
jgi:ABC-2 type transport system ATP-binding protein